ncbi:MAG TPA: hypothetical protein VLH80_02165 [Nitrospiraceae bacterium]|nr:hypothetical protein [Nitrospiraceae bacterium]
MKFWSPEQRHTVWGLYHRRIPVTPDNHATHLSAIGCLNVFFSATPTAALAADQPTGLTDYLRGLFRYK